MCQRGYVRMHAVPPRARRGQQIPWKQLWTDWRLVWVLGTELMCSRRAAMCSEPLNRLSSPSDMSSNRTEIMTSVYYHNLQVLNIYYCDFYPSHLSPFLPSPFLSLYICVHTNMCVCTYMCRCICTYVCVHVKARGNFKVSLLKCHTTVFFWDRVSWWPGTSKNSLDQLASKSQGATSLCVPGTGIIKAPDQNVFCSKGQSK